MEGLIKLIDRMWEELNDSKWYALEAMKTKHENKTKSDLFCQLSKEEFSHFERLHDQAIRCLNDMRDEHGHVPEDVHKLWVWEQGKLIERSAEVKRYHDMARG